ncbi:hypothetical protein [[Eubacterium] cellulosolvens]
MSGPEVLLLDFPETLEREIDRLAAYETSYEELIGKIRQERLLPEPLESWTYLTEPVLRALPRVKLMRPELEISCYTSREAPFSAIENATKIARLVFRVRATGRVEIDEWRSAIATSLDRNREVFDDEVSKLVLKARGRDAACLTGLEAFRLKRRIARHWNSATVRSAEPFYYRTPLEMLLRLFSRGEVSDEQLLTLALAHVEYVYKYVLSSRDRDEAYNKWVKQRISKSRTRWRCIDVSSYPALDTENERCLPR